MKGEVKITAPQPVSSTTSFGSVTPAQLPRCNCKDGWLVVKVTGRHSKPGAPWADTLATLVESASTF